MRRLLLTLQYDGTNYAGWQVQKNAVTVQQTLQNAVEAVLGARLAVTGCSRTDAGVHSRMFCCHLDTDTNISDKKLIFAFNAHLPRDIAVVGCREVAGDFHARYSCVSKEYVYQMFPSPHRNPFFERYALHVRGKLSPEQMNLAASLLVRKADFASFCASGSSVQDTVRTVQKCEIVCEDELTVLHIEADGFLYHMVRIIAGTLLEVGLNRRTPEDIEAILTAKSRERAGPTAPAHALFLNNVRYI